MRTLALTFLLVFCSCKHGADKLTQISIVADSGRTVVAVTPNDELVDGGGRVVGRVEWKAPEVIVGDIHEALKFDIEANGILVATPMRSFHAVVGADSQLLVDGKLIGKVRGFASSKEDWRRLAALILATPMLPSQNHGDPLPAHATATTPDAATDQSAPAPPPPPPAKP